MKRLAASALFAMGVLQMSQAGSQGTDPGAIAAGELARTKLARELGAAPDAIRVVSVQATTFRDASLGCRRPGTATAQVITEGYTVTLEKGSEHRRVNVAGSRAVICDVVPRYRDPGRMPARASGLDKITVQAREDLAARLHIEPSQIRIGKIEPQRWADDTLGCATPEKASTDGPVAGFRLYLFAKDQIFTYHTDLTQVMPCPPVEDR